MKNDFITLYTQIETSEQEGFQKYIHCFYEQQKTVVELFEQVKKHMKTQSLDTFEWKGSSRKNMLNAFSDLKKWLLEYLALQEIKSNGTEAKLFIVETLQKRGLEEIYLQKSKQLSRELTDSASMDTWRMAQKLRLDYIHYFQRDFDPLQDFEKPLQELIDQLDTYYISSKLKYNAELISRSRIMLEEYQQHLLPEIQLLIDNEAVADPSVKKLYYPLYQLIKDQSETAYAELKTFLETHTDHDIFEKYAVWLYLLNHIVAKVRDIDSKYTNDYIEIVNLGIKQSLVNAYGFFPMPTFMNIVNMTCYLGKLDWVEAFIKKWSKHLEASQRDVITQFAWARLNFERKNFDKVKTLLKDVEYLNFNLNINARTLLIRACYEQDDSADLILDYCKSLYLYVTRNQSINDVHKNNLINFTHIMRSLLNKKSKEQLLKEFYSKQGLMACRDWLFAKINDI